MYQVFVFGTLKEGFPNHKTNKGVRLGSDYLTKEAFPLLLVGERHSPWLVLDEGKGQPVKGQVFTVSENALVQMDRLERINEPDGYRRVTIPVICAETNNELEVFVYGKPKEMTAKSDIRMELSGEYLLEHANMYRSRAS
ncbi:gamma-glutamylcyclotransferase family protein [Vibrio sp. 99-70-13A1]|uniref:gamma-glutamylcyclotransferase family protein n=1 Tax=Vibrio sp. 99-70-13A1 TaxID=2607601 RepID=UPI0014939418|nr:gamma-glutamylcyclotransferase family protein [Vibrio sp. 99-70-13A1]NOH97744.1 gamma-glutamylcyclotransferase [Vibrio sp. 99-70-13A1]